MPSAPACTRPQSRPGPWKPLPTWTSFRSGCHQPYDLIFGWTKTVRTSVTLAFLIFSLSFVPVYRARLSEAAAPLAGPLIGMRIHPRVSTSSSKASAAAPLAAHARWGATAASTAWPTTLLCAHPRSGGDVFHAHTWGVAASTTTLALAHDDGRRWVTPSRAHPRSGDLYGDEERQPLPTSTCPHRTVGGSTPLTSSPPMRRWVNLDF
jgi:hypothetical protein